MKNIWKVKKLSGISNILILLICCLGGQLKATVVERLIEQEIEVPANVTVRTQGAVIPRLEMHGWVSSNTEAGAYTLEGREQLVLKIYKRFDIHTWEKNSLKESVRISVRAETPEIEEALINDLKSDLRLNADNSIDVNCILGIDRMIMRNGWLRGNDNTIVLRNGNRYKIDYLEISASITIPNTANLKIDSQFTEFNIGDIEGEVKANLQNGVLTGTFINELNGKFLSSIVKIKSVNKATISSIRSNFTIDTAGELNIGKLPLDFKKDALVVDYAVPYDPVEIFTANNDQTEKWSTLNKYKVETLTDLKMFSSLNDKVNIEHLGKAYFENVKFTDVNIMNLEKGISGGVSYGSINVYAIHPIDFETIDLESFFGSLRLVVQDVPKVLAEIKHDPVIQETFLPGMARNPNSSIKVKDDFSLLKKIDESRTLYAKGNAMEGDGKALKFNINCNNCELILQ